MSGQDRVRVAPVGGDTSFYPITKSDGEWRVQSTNKHIIRILKNRCRQAKKWRQVGYSMNENSPDIFATEFSSLRDAARSFDHLISVAESKRLHGAKTLPKHVIIDALKGNGITGNGGES